MAPFKKPSSAVYLLFSTDLIKSTPRKYCPDNKSIIYPFSKWATPFLAFYSEFSDLFPSNAFSKGLPSHCLPQIWKYVGDEILFRSRIDSWSQAGKLVLCFQESLREFLQYWMDQKVSFELKSTIWTAGFPVRNFSIQPFTHSLDFIGPEIDFGFRLSSFAESDSLLISPELAKELSSEPLFQNSKWRVQYPASSEAKKFKGIPFENKDHTVFPLCFLPVSGTNSSIYDKTNDDINIDVLRFQQSNPLICHTKKFFSPRSDISKCKQFGVHHNEICEFMQNFTFLPLNDF